jgi:hypothetical protein
MGHIECPARVSDTALGEVFLTEVVTTEEVSA